MKVKMSVVREIEVEIDSTALRDLEVFWRNNSGKYHTYTPELEALVSQAVADVEKASGLPFGDDEAFETISAVYAMDGEPILEW